MPFDISPGHGALLALALLGAAYVRGYSGFGFSAIFITFATLLMNPLPLIPVVFTCEILMTAFQARGVRSHVDWTRVAALIGGAAVVLPFSVSIILSLGETQVRLAVSLIVLIASLVLLSGWTLKTLIRTKGNIAIGMVSGVCNAAGIGGLPVAATMTAQPIPAARFRATMIVYLTALDLLTLPFLWVGGLVTRDTATGLAFAFPLVALGVWLGGRRFGAASPDGFRTFAIVLLFVLATLGVLRALF